MMKFITENSKHLPSLLTLLFGEENTIFKFIFLMQRQCKNFLKWASLFIIFYHTLVIFKSSIITVFVVVK